MATWRGLATLRSLSRPAANLLQAGLTNVVWADLGGDPKYGSVKKCLKFPGAGDFHPVRFRDEMVGNARGRPRMLAICQP